MQAAYDQFWSEARPLMVNEGVPKDALFDVWFEEQSKIINRHPTVGSLQQERSPPVAKSAPMSKTRPFHV